MINFIKKYNKRILFGLGIFLVASIVFYLSVIISNKNKEYIINDVFDDPSIVSNEENDGEPVSESIEGQYNSLETNPPTDNFIEINEEVLEHRTYN